MGNKRLCTVALQAALYWLVVVVRRPNGHQTNQILLWRTDHIIQREKFTDGISLMLLVRLHLSTIPWLKLARSEKCIDANLLIVVGSSRRGELLWHKRGHSGPGLNRKRSNVATKVKTIENKDRAVFFRERMCPLFTYFHGGDKHLDWKNKYFQLKPWRPKGHWIPRLATHT